ncbi:MAG: DegT/DnrJ/EryC1/StrS family aminotransferase [Syntrophobacterales bacterium]|jgi:dTDP-4-amino-4,6-dideoxygalactose transaminase
MKVPLLDLKAQYQTIRDEIKEAVDEVLESQHFILGPKVEALEEAVAPYCGCQCAVGVSSGTDGLLIALMAAGIGSGHGVISTPFTFFATGGSIVRAGSRPFFVDIDPVTYNVDPVAIKAFVEAECRFESDTGRLVHEKTGMSIRAIMPVHLYGQCADMDGILEIANEHGLVVLEDGAQAIGAEYPSIHNEVPMRAGSMGHFGCFSFFPSKNLGGFGDGGMVTTNDAETADRLKILRVHGSKPKYYHHLVGGNFRLDALQAAVLLVKLKYLDGWTAKRRQNAAYYNALFQQSSLVEKGFIVPPRAVWEESSAENGVNPQSAIRNPQLIGHIYNQYVIRAKKRDELRAYLTEQNIGTEIYYPLALHQQQCFVELGYKAGDFPESEKAAAETMALPVYPELDEIQQEYVVEQISSFYDV